MKVLAAPCLANKKSRRKRRQQQRNSGKGFDKHLDDAHIHDGNNYSTETVEYHPNEKELNLIKTDIQMKFF